MSPFTVDDEALKKQTYFNISRPQEEAPDPLPANFTGVPNQGLPVKRIPHMDFPRVVYMHPNEPYRTIEHRNEKFEVVGTEVVPNEHLSKVVAGEEELKAALEEGWVKEPYIPKAPPNPNAHLYGKHHKAKG